MSRLWRLARRVCTLPPREILTTVHATVVLGVVEALIRWVRLPRLARLLGVRVDLGPARPDAEPLTISQLPSLARRQVRCAHRVTDAWPFSRGPCLRRSLVVGHLLRDHEPAIRLGLAGAAETMVGHAWLEIDDRPLERIDGYHVFQFARPDLAR